MATASSGQTRLTGHARGWRTQGRATLPKDWRCILDHYYNDNYDSTGAGPSGSLRTAYVNGGGGDDQILFSLWNSKAQNTYM